MAANLLSKSWAVQVSDVDAQKVTKWESKGAVAHVLARLVAPDSVANAESIRAPVVPGLSAVIVCVVDAAQTEDVLFGVDGLAHTLRAGQTVILCPHHLAPGR